MRQLLIITFALLSFNGQSQQIGLNSQYMFNLSSINPGVTGTLGYTQIHLNARKQWAKFEGSPVSQTLSANGYLGKNMSLGGSLYNDLAGATRSTGLMVMSAYRLRLSQNNLHHINAGIGFSFTQHYIDLDRLDTYLPNDPVFGIPVNNQFVPDANIGFYYTYNKKATLGIAARNLLQSNRDLFDFNTTFVNPMVRNYYLHGSYQFDLAKKWTLTPTVMFRMIDALATQLDVTTVATYNKFLWFGFSYRHNDAVVGLAGAQFGAFKFGYSYDYTLSDINQYSTGSHEIFLELQIFPAKGQNSNIPWLKRNRIYGPSF
jgi:type IX secretion system PorP/SprF family membrane protein